MPLYSFEGRNERTGEVARGLREASSHAALGQDLLSEGILLTRYVQRTAAKRSWSLLAAVTRRVPVVERQLFARYFALMLRSGLDVKGSLAALQQQTHNRSMKQALASIYEEIERGKTLAESMRSFPYAFPPLFVSFIEVGEATGRLQESLEILAHQLEKEYQLKRAVRGGLLYPAVIIVAMVAVGAAMLYFVIPRLVEIFEGFDVELPLSTRILIFVSQAFQNYWALLLALLGVAVVGAVMLWRMPAVRSRLLHWLLRAPIVGAVVQKVNLARFARDLASLLKSGVSYVNALGILGDNIPHPSYARVMREAREHVKEGKELSGYLVQFPLLFPPIVVNVLQVGEKTGTLDQVLEETAVFYEGEVDQTMKNLTTVMEPVLMVLVGLAVGALAVSVISPIYDLVNVI